MRHARMWASLGMVAACGPSEPTFDPTTTTLTSGTTALLQAVSVVNGDTVWVSGHDGTYARTTDGGVDLMWEFTADETVRGIEIYRSFGGNDLPVKVHRGLIPPSQRDYRDEGIAAGEKYYYTVVA